VITAALIAAAIGAAYYASK